MNYMKCLSVVILLIGLQAMAQKKALVNTTGSKHAALHPLDMDAVKWTSGFWAERFQTCRDSMVPHLWQTYNDASVSHAFKNFEIAAGLDTGSHKGPSFHDGDFYKTLESVASVYATTKDNKLNTLMDDAIAVIAKAQRADGYIYTKAMIDQKKTGEQTQFQDRLSFEAYNIGHLMTAACVHFRATGKTTLLNVAIKATEYLYRFYKQASPALARNAICPSHYMGVVEMYRTTQEPRYLELARHLIDIKGKIEDGTDDNQDRVPFRDQYKAMGHAVRANYLYAGVADLYAETGDTTLINRLNEIWKDVVLHKMYITGGCGSLYDGVSPDGTVYQPSIVQKIHQAYGRDFQLPNLTAHNETCANIGNVLWNYRMLLLTGEAKYADVMELALYNSVLSGVSLGGKAFLYTNPLAYSDDLPFQQRWSKDRVPYISLSNCCPPNVVRTVAQVSNYAYGLSEKGLWLHLYGSNQIVTQLKDRNRIQLIQKTAYPWNGNIHLRFEKTDEKEFTLFLRIPGWSKDAQIKVNGKPYHTQIVPGTYATVRGRWKKGDVIELDFPMPAVLVEANPLVEETRNQVTVKRGPVVYCLESTDLKNESIFDIAVATQSAFKPVPLHINGHTIFALDGNAQLIRNESWDNVLYREVSNQQPKNIAIRLIPYFAWGNRGHTEMTVWMPVIR